MKHFDKFKMFKSLGYIPHRGQLEVHRSKAPRRILACGVRWGKTECAAMEAIALALTPRKHSIGWIVAPTFELSDKIMRIVVAAFNGPLQIYRIDFKQSEKRLIVRNLGGGISEIRAKSADNPTSLLGEGLDWVIVDEAAQLAPLIWNTYLVQRLLDKHGIAMLISTPKGKGYFYDLYRRGQNDRDPDFESWNLPSSDNPYLSADLIEAERARLPEADFRTQYLAEFIEGAGAVFHSVRECATGEFKPPEPNRAYYAGLDLGKHQDFTVLVIVNRDREVVFVDRFTDIEWSIQINRAKASCDRYSRAHVLVDSTGAGEPVLENMQQAGMNVEGYNFTASSKADLINNLSLMIEKRRLVLPRPELWPEGIDELESYQYKSSESGNFKTSAPSGYFDDCVSALALAAWQVKNPPEQFRIRSFNDWNDVARYVRGL